MSSNIEFKSNVYPFLKSMQLDKVYLSKIYNYERLVDFNNRYFKLNSKDTWNKLQLEIISLSPACSIDSFKDPCRGLIKEKDNFEFVCKCVNTSCKNFNICRSSFDQTEYDLFSPVVNTFDENLYGYNKQKYEMYPVFHLIREIVIDNSVIKITTPIEKEYENQVKYEDDTIIDAFKIIDKSETDELKSLGIEESESTETGNVELETETDINNDINDTKTAKTTPDTLENIFDSFTSADQQDIINASPSEVIFVNAGPGTGKTYTLIQKLIYMVTEYEVDPESIMVLCFTNAAVDEIRYRLNVVVSNGGHRGLMNVDIRTFHSFAWWLIGQANESFLDDGWTEVNMHSLNFDKSISVASKVISKFSTRIFDGWQHFIVDEVQDLTNNLARFVLRIINSCLNKGCGVTALGDSCQAIYDYTQMENVNPMTSEEFYTTLYRNIKHKARFLKLSVNHRQTNDLKELATKYRGSILSANISNMASEVSSLSQDIEYIEKTPIDINEKDLEELCKLGKLSILLRNNVQTLKLSSVFRKRGINHILNVNETHQNFSSWISEVFFYYDKPTISFDKFGYLYLDTSSYRSNNLSPETIWLRIKELMHSKSDVLNVSELLLAISESKIDDSVFRAKRSGDIIVSNIHRAKGREYETVVIDKDFADGLKKGDRDIGEYKTLYVAITRPKEMIYSAKLSKSSGMKPIKIFKTNRKRWAKTNGKKIVHLELNSELDIDIKSYLTANQSYISKINEGDHIELRRTIDKDLVNYEVIHRIDDEPAMIGHIGHTYIEDFKFYMGISDNELIRMPDTIDELYVTGVYSFIANEDYKQLHPEITEISPNGIWKWVQFAGIGHATYDVY